jgi:hypothetical protein
MEEYKLKIYLKTKCQGKYLNPKDISKKWRKVYNEELHYLYFSPSTVRMIKLRGL